MKIWNSQQNFNAYLYVLFWRSGVVVITTAQLHSMKPELRFCTGSNPVPGLLEIRDGEDFCQWSRLEIRLNAFCRSTILQFIIQPSLYYSAFSLLLYFYFCCFSFAISLTSIFFKCPLPRKMFDCLSNLISISLLIMPNFTFVRKQIMDFEIKLGI